MSVSPGRAATHRPAWPAPLIDAATCLALKLPHPRRPRTLSLGPLASRTSITCPRRQPAHGHRGATPRRRGRVAPSVRRGNAPGLPGNSTSLVKAGPTPAFVFARVSSLADGGAACVRVRKSRASSQRSPLLPLIREGGSDAALLVSSGESAARAPSALVVRLRCSRGASLATDRELRRRVALTLTAAVGRGESAGSYQHPRRLRALHARAEAPDRSARAAQGGRMWRSRRPAARHGSELLGRLLDGSRGCRRSLRVSGREPASVDGSCWCLRTGG